jgi:Tol biopolymer transport system component
VLGAVLLVVAVGVIRLSLGGSECTTRLVIEIPVEEDEFTRPGNAIAISIDGGALRRLTTDPDSTDPSFSPDRSRIVFASSRNHDYSDETGGTEYDIFVMDADGSNQRLLIGKGSDPDWSPDGEQIVFVRGSEILLHDLDSGSESRIARAKAERVHPTLVDEPVWLADGKRIAYIQRTRAIWIMDSSGRDREKVTELTNAYVLAPSPTQNRLAIAGGDESDMLHVVEVDKSRPLELSIRNAFSPLWTPDGEGIHFVEADTNEEREVDLATGEITSIRTPENATSQATDFARGTGESMACRP